MRNFVGIDSLDFSATGKNLLDVSSISGTFGGVTYANDENGIVSLNGTKIGSTYAPFPNSRIAMRAGISYTFSINLLSGTIRDTNQNLRNLQCYLISTDNVSMGSIIMYETESRKSITVTPDEDIIVYLRFAWWSDNTVITDVQIQMQIEINNMLTDFVKYDGAQKTFSFDRTIYAGELDVLTGIFTATHKLVDMGSLLWKYSNAYGNNLFYTNSISDMAEIAMLASSQYKYAGVITSSGEFSSIVDETIVKWRGASRVYLVDSNYTNVSSFTQMLIENNAQLLYELETPIVINLGGMNIETLQGENNLFASTGDTTVQYFKK